MDPELLKQLLIDGFRFSSMPLNINKRQPETLNEDDRSVSVVMASENPVEVFDFRTMQIIDEVLLMSGLQNEEGDQLPLLDSHDRHSVRNMLGSVRGIHIENDKVIGRAFYSKISQGEDAFTLVREKHLTDYSVGFRILKSTFVPDEEKTVIGGREFEGPVRVVTSWRMFELSNTPIGADATAKARSLHETNTNKKQVTKPESQEEEIMNPKIRALLEKQGLKHDATEAEANAFLLAEVERKAVKLDDVNKIDANAVKEAEKARAEGAEKERLRISEINNTCKRHDCADLAANFIDKGQTIEAVREAVLKHLTDRATPPAPSSDVDLVKDGRDKIREAAEDSIYLRAGVKIGKPAEGAEDLRGYSLRELARESLRRANLETGGNVMQMVGRALTTSDFPLLLANIANKELLRGFEQNEETWQVWAGTGSVPDFKTLDILAASEFSNLEEVVEGGEFKFSKRSEKREQVQVLTFGKLYWLSRQAIINDDLGAITDAPRGMGEAAARLVGDTVYNVLINNAAMVEDDVALFNAAHDNLLTDAALSITSIQNSIKQMKLQKNLLGDATLNIRPRFFLAPVAIEGTAENFFRASLPENQAGLLTGSLGEVNPYAGNFFTRVYEPRLDADSAVKFYLAGRPDQTVKAYFLNGITAPFMEERQGWNVDGREWKVRLDVAAVAVDFRALQSNTAG